MLKVRPSEILWKTVQFFFLLIMLFLLISLIPCFISNFDQEEQASREKQEIAAKVLAIMARYQCDNPEIYEAIMATFDPVLVAVVIAVESGFRVDAVSRAGCRGLMQLSPDKLEDWRNIRLNIQVGAAYLETQLQRFKDPELAFAAYNAGPETVRKYQGVPPFPETIAYLEKIKSFGLSFDDSSSGGASKISSPKQAGFLLSKAP